MCWTQLSATIGLVDFLLGCFSVIPYFGEVGHLVPAKDQLNSLGRWELMYLWLEITFTSALMASSCLQPLHCYWTGWSQGRTMNLTSRFLCSVRLQQWIILHGIKILQHTKQLEIPNIYYFTFIITFNIYHCIVSKTEVTAYSSVSLKR